MDRLIKQFIRGTGPEAHLDANAFRAYAREQAMRGANMSDAERQASVDMVNRLVSSGGAGIAALNQIEGDYEVLNILRDSPVLDFIEMRPLPVGTLPIYRTKIINPVGVFMGSLAGGGSTHNYITTQNGAYVQPFTFSTEKVMTPNLNNLFDMEKLSLRKDANDALDRYCDQAMVNIGINTVLGATNALADPATSLSNYISGGGSFSGKTVYFLDPGVVTAAVPTVNYYNLASEGGLTKAVFRTVNTHSIQIGRNFNRMYIPTAATSGKSPVWESLQNMATPVALITGTGLNNSPAAAVPAEMWSQFQKEDFRGEVVVNWFGQTIAVRKQNWMPAGSAMLFSDQPAGVMWDRLNLEGPGSEGTLETPIDGFYSYKQRSKNVATLRADYHLRNFLVLSIQS